MDINGARSGVAVSMDDISHDDLRAEYHHKLRYAFQRKGTPRKGFETFRYSELFFTTLCEGLSASFFASHYDF